MSSSCNQVVVSNGTESRVLKLPIGYYTFTEFISMTIEDDYVRFNDQSNSWYFDRYNVDTTINGYQWTPWFKLSPSVRNLCIEKPVETQFDPTGSSLPDETNDQGLGGHAYLDQCYLDQCFVEYDYRMRTTTTFFILKPQVTYTMTNADGTLFSSGTFYVTENTDTLLSLQGLRVMSLSKLNAKYQEVRDITSSHQEAIAWSAGNTGSKRYVILHHRTRKRLHGVLAIRAIRRHGQPMLTLLISSSR